MSAVSASGGGTSVAVGVIMAANTIGAGFQNLLDSAVDTIAGGNVIEDLGADQGSTAYIKDSSVNAGGALNVLSSSTESVNATVGNTTLADIQPSDSARSTSAGAVLSTNQILTTVTAYINNDSTGDTVASGGAIAVSATDNAGITTSTTMTALGHARRGREQPTTTPAWRCRPPQVHQQIEDYRRKSPLQHDQVARATG